MKSLRAQLAWRLFIGGALLLGVGGMLAYWQMQRALMAEADAALRALAQSIATLAEQKNGEISLELPGEGLPQLGQKDAPDVFLLRTAGGGEVARSPSLGTNALPTGAGTVAAPSFADVVLGDGRILRCAGLRFTPAEEDEDEHPSRVSKVDAVLVVGRDRAPLERTLATLRMSLWLAGVTALGLLVALVHWGLRRGLAPVSALAGQVSAIHATSLGRRLSVEPLPLELQPIAVRLNELLARLEAAFERERRFTATAAHELRTPLAELRTLAEVSLGTPATIAEHTESWDDALKTILGMESLAVSLLELARADAGSPSAHGLRSEPVRLGEAVDKAWVPFSARAAARLVSLRTELDEAWSVQADPGVLGIVLGNLCANAAEYAVRGTAFRIHAENGADTVTLHFRNQTENLMAVDVPHLFERFWRKDEARTDRRRHGLGLALAMEFAKLTGATLTASVEDNSEVDFALCLPRAQEGPKARPAK